MGARAMEEQAMTLTQTLAERLIRPVDEAARRRARLHVADWVGYAAAAVSSEVSDSLTRYARGRPAGPSSIVMGRGCQPEMAAFVNAGLGLVLELDDVHRGAKLHPGPVVIPTALALAESLGSSFDEMLDAVVRGYEAMIRIGESLGAEHYRHWHTTSTCGTFGAAAVAGSLLGLDAEKLTHALGNAGTQSAGLWQCRLDQAMSKSLHAGRAAQAGLVAAELAATGFTGPHRILEGDHGLYAATSVDADPEAIAGGSAAWRIYDTSIKPWAGCRHVHPTISAALVLHGSIGPASDIRELAIHTYDAAIDFADQPDPSSMPDALFSLQHAAAWAIVHGVPSARTFTHDGIADTAVAAVRERATVTRDESLDRRYPFHWGARVVVTSSQGVAEATASDALGDPEMPLTEQQLRRKSSSLLEGAGVVDPDGVVQACLELAGHRTVTDLTDCWRTAGMQPRAGEGPAGLETSDMTCGT